LGLLSRMLLRRHLSRWVYLDGDRSLGSSRKQPVLPPPCIGNAASRPARARRAHHSRTGAAVRPRGVDDRTRRHSLSGGCTIRHGEITMSAMIPCPVCFRHVRATDARCPFCGAVREGAAATAPSTTTRGLSRATLYAMGAAIATGVV